MTNEREMFRALSIMEEALGIIDEDSLDMTTEGYVGRVKETAKIEAACKKICDKYKGKGIVSISNAEIHGSPEIKEIEEAIQDLTGFRKVDIVVQNDTRPNAATAKKSIICRAISNEMPLMPTEHGKRYYDKSHDYYCHIELNAGIFAEFEPDECTAFILHEVGHNFDHTLSFWLFDIFMWIITLPAGPISILRNIFRVQIQFVIDSLFKLLDYLPIVPIVRNLRIETLRSFDILLGPLGVTSKIFKYLERIEKDPESLLIGGIRVHSEMFADSYVNSMGYGDALIRAVNKLEKREYVTKNGPVIEFWTGAGEVSTALMAMFLDPHPEAQTRARLLLDDMEKTSKDSTLPSHMRRSLAEQHKRMKKAYDEFVEADPVERDAVCTRFARRMKESLFGGKIDLRALAVILLGGTSAMRGR